MNKVKSQYKIVMLFGRITNPAASALISLRMLITRCLSCSLNSTRYRPLLNASIALSSEMSSAELLSIVHRW